MKSIKFTLFILTGILVSGCTSQLNLTERERPRFYEFCLNSPIPGVHETLAERTSIEDSTATYKKSLSDSGEYTCTFKDNKFYKPVAQVAAEYIGHFAHDYQVGYRAAFDENRNFIYNINQNDKLYYDVNFEGNHESALLSLQLIGVTAGEIPSDIIAERQKSKNEGYVR